MNKHLAKQILDLTGTLTVVVAPYIYTVVATKLKEKKRIKDENIYVIHEKTIKP